jgi:hypothetical protein
MHLFHFAIEVGKLTKEGLQRFSEWLEEQNQPAAPVQPTEPMTYWVPDVFGANEPLKVGSFGALGDRRSSDRLSFDEIVHSWNAER